MTRRGGWGRLLGWSTVAALAIGAVVVGVRRAERFAPPGERARSERGEAPPPRVFPPRGALPVPPPPAGTLDATTDGEPGADEDEREIAALLHHALAETWADRFPERPLSADALAELGDALLDLRAARTRLAGLPVDAAHAAERRALTVEVAEAARRFERTAGMSVDTFTTMVEPDSGLTREETDAELRSSDDAQ